MLTYSVKYSDVHLDQKCFNYFIEPRTKMSKRSRSCTITSINKFFENQINEICNNYDQDKLTLLYSLKEVVEKNLKKVVTLSEEIGEGIEGHEEFATRLDE